MAGERVLEGRLRAERLRNMPSARRPDREEGPAAGAGAAPRTARWPGLTQADPMPTAPATDCRTCRRRRSRRSPRRSQHGQADRGHEVHGHRDRPIHARAGTRRRRCVPRIAPDAVAHASRSAPSTTNCDLLRENIFLRSRSHAFPGPPGDCLGHSTAVLDAASIHAPCIGTARCTRGRGDHLLGGGSGVHCTRPRH